AKLPRSYWSWDDMVEFNATGYFPSTPATNLLFGLREALAMLREEGLPNTFARHRRLAGATRAAVAAWGLEVFALNPAEQSNTVTTVLLPSGTDAETVRRVALERYDLSLGAGLGKLKGQVFRIGHLGDLNELMLAGALCGVEMALHAARVSIRRGGVQAALDQLISGGD
ncbi:MAG TPA: serine--glyoxylate aminotransferase, partial [Gemmatimonadales bacterium]